MTRPLNVFICNANPSEEGLFVPIIFGMLKSFADQDAALRSAFAWLEPLMSPKTFDEFDALYDAASIDVVGISLYQWNYLYEYGLAQHIKQANPSCIVIAGGPQTQWKEPDYFERHPFVDFAIPAEGEAPFSDILHARLNGFASLEDIQGTLVNPRYGSFPYVVAPPLDLATKPSPWLSLKDFWRGYFKRYEHHRLAAIIESSRGCPYGCTYCDWGSKTNLRVRKVPDQTVLEEIDFIVGELRPWFMFWTDANLGIFERDAAMAERFATLRKQSERPLWLYYNNNKNSWQTNLRIAEHFRDAQLLTKYVLSLQHTDPEVLRAIKRKNLPPNDVARLIRELDRIDYASFTQLIAGCPGDTFDKWLSAFTDLMDMGLHGEYRAYPFSLLPNSPANEPDYLAQWDIKTITRPDFVAYYFLKNDDLSWALSSSVYVVGTSSYTQDDYEKMWLLCWLIQALHDHAITRRIAIALNFGGVASYRTFYRAVYDWFYDDASMARFARPMQSHIHEWLVNPAQSLLKRCDPIDGLVEPEEDLSLRIMLERDAFFEALEAFLVRRFAVPRDLVRYQRDVLYVPSDTVNSRSTALLPRRWVEYFEAVENDPFEARAWHEESGAATYAIDGSNLQFPVPLWCRSRNPHRRLVAYYDQMIQHNVAGKRRTIVKKLAGTCDCEGESHAIMKKLGGMCSCEGGGEGHATATQDASAGLSASTSCDREQHKVTVTATAPMPFHSPTATGPCSHEVHENADRSKAGERNALL